MVIQPPGVAVPVQPALILQPDPRPATVGSGCNQVFLVLLPITLVVVVVAQVVVVQVAQVAQVAAAQVEITFRLL
jgi:hypothetical protein